MSQMNEQQKEALYQILQTGPLSIDGKMTVSPAFIGTTMNKVLIATKDGQKQVEPLKPVVDSIRAVAGFLTE